MVTEFNVNTNTLTPKFVLGGRRIVFGDFMLTTNGKFIVTNQQTNTGDIYISQYNYASGLLEFDLLISSPTPGPAITTPYGLFERGSNIYIMDSTTGVYLINKTSPYSRTLIGIPTGNQPNDRIYGSSQIASCIVNNFTSNVTTTTTTTTLFPYRYYEVREWDSVNCEAVGDVFVARTLSLPQGGFVCINNTIYIIVGFGGGPSFNFEFTPTTANSGNEACVQFDFVC
jgi:hypothetical protein